MPIDEVAVKAAVVHEFGHPLVVEVSTINAALSPKRRAASGRISPIVATIGEP